MKWAIAKLASLLIVMLHLLRKTYLSWLYFQSNSLYHSAPQCRRLLFKIHVQNAYPLNYLSFGQLIIIVTTASRRIMFLTHKPTNQYLHFLLHHHHFVRNWWLAGSFWTMFRPALSICSMMSWREPEKVELPRISTMLSKTIQGEKLNKFRKNHVFWCRKFEILN